MSHIQLQDVGGSLVGRALASGEWKEVQDPATGRVVFYHPATHKVVRDLRLELLRSFDVLQGSSAGNVTAGTADTTQATTAPSLEAQLGAVRSLNERLFLELTHLRHALFAAHPMMSKGCSTPVTMPFSGGMGSMSADWAATAAAAATTAGHALPRPAEDRRESAAVAAIVGPLQERLRLAEALNQRLYSRVVEDRTRQRLCARCGALQADVAAAVADVVALTPLPGGSPRGGWGSVPRLNAEAAVKHLTDPVVPQVDAPAVANRGRAGGAAMPPWGAAAAQQQLQSNDPILDRPPLNMAETLAAAAAIGPVGLLEGGSVYLPHTFTRTEVATAHAPLRLSAIPDVPTSLKPSRRPVASGLPHSSGKLATPSAMAGGAPTPVSYPSSLRTPVDGGRPPVTTAAAAAVSPRAPMADSASLITPPAMRSFSSINSPFFAGSSPGSGYRSGEGNFSPR